MTADLFIALTIIFAFFAGLWLGSHLAHHKWASNVYEVRRLEYRGRRYKVLHADDYARWYRRGVE